MKAYSVDIIIALKDGQEPSAEWWANRFEWAFVRAGGMPPELEDPQGVTLTWETDPETDEEYARVNLPLPAGTGYARARELAHLLTSVLAAVGYTLRADGERIEELPGEADGPLEGEFGSLAYADGRVCSARCIGCFLASDTRLGCCTQGAAYSMADIGSMLMHGEEVFVRSVLALPGERDGDKWHPYLTGGACTFHNPNQGCTLARHQMPLQCRTYICLPEQLLPPALLAEHDEYVATLDDAEGFIGDHMREVSGVGFDSPLEELKAAAVKAFAAWEAELASTEPDTSEKV